MKDELDGITTIRQIRSIIERTNQRLESVRWFLRKSQGTYRLIKYVIRKDRNGKKYWWHEKIIGYHPRDKFISEFIKLCRSDKRDTISKAAYSHEDITAFKESLGPEEPEQMNIFHPAGG